VATSLLCFPDRVFWCFQPARIAFLGEPRKTIVFLALRMLGEGEEPVVGSGGEMAPESQDRRVLSIVSEREPSVPFASRYR